MIQRLRSLLIKESGEREFLDLNKVFMDVAGLLNPEMIHRGMELEMQLAEDPPKVKAGSVEVQQVLMNLAMNGIESMAACHSPFPKLIVRSLVMGHDVRVDVADTGAGIPEEWMDQIFKPFHTTKKGGLGMGLAICSRILETYGGSMGAENNPKGGSTFWFFSSRHRGPG